MKPPGPLPFSNQEFVVMHALYWVTARAVTSYEFLIDQYRPEPAFRKPSRIVAYILNSSTKIPETNNDTNRKSK